MLVACCLMYGGAVGIIGNSAGIYLHPVSEEMGWPLASLNGYLTVVSLVMTVTLPIAGWVLPRVRLQWVIAAALTAACATYAGSALFTTLTHWYIAGAVLGVCYAFLLYIPVPLVVNNWFRTRNGLAIGITAAFASLVAAFANPIGGALITSVGWRETRVIMGSIAWVLAVPITIALIRLRPEQLGMRPYGAPDEVAVASDVTAPAPERQSLARAVRSLPFVCTVVLGGLFAFGASMLQQAPSHASAVGLDATTGAAGVSAIMIGGICAKLLLGQVHDRYGIGTTTAISTALGVLGSILVIVAAGDATGFLIGCFLFGGGYAGLVVVPPLTVRHFFGTVNYSRLYSWVTVALGLFSAAAPIGYARIYDVTGSFDGAWIASMSAFILIAVLMGVALGYERRHGSLATLSTEGAH
ncbi:MAG: MFS transporter, partial [Actinobacteria bacterium]|nr:MFS transporter [Actinomycetota bacterium]